MTLLLMWLGCGLLAVGMENYYRRMTFPAMFIEDYWEAAENNQPAYDTMDFFFYFAATCFGPVALGLALYLNAPEYGLSYRFTKWTQEEAKVLFPNNYSARMGRG
jgi:hypothetical protein